MITSFAVEDVIIEPFGPVYNGPGALKYDQPFVLRKLEISQIDAIQRAKKYAMEQNVKVVLLRQTQQSQSLQMNAARRNQTLTLLNRVYIGSISYDIKEEMIKQAFLPFGPVKNVSMSWDPVTQKHKGFAFVEFEYPEAAQLAIEQMNGTNFGGRLLKVGRPSNLPDAAPFMAELISDFKLQNRIYVAGVHLDLTDSDIALVFQAFGNITMCRLAQDPLRPGFHRGFGYVEFDSEQSANAAVVSMNRFDLGGQLLRVTKAISPPEGINTSPVISQLPAATAVAAATVTAKLLSMDAEQVSEASSLAGKLVGCSSSRSPLDRHKARSRSRRRSSDGRRHSFRRCHRRASCSTSSSTSSRSRRHSRHCIQRQRSIAPPSTHASGPTSGVKPKQGTVVSEVKSDSATNVGSCAAIPSSSGSGSGKWQSFSLEEEQASNLVRSNDSRLYDIPSPSAIPLPPAPPPNTSS